MGVDTRGVAFEYVFFFFTQILHVRLYRRQLKMGADTFVKKWISPPQADGVSTNDAINFNVASNGVLDP